MLFDYANAAALIERALPNKRVVSGCLSHFPPLSGCDPQQHSLIKQDYLEP
jgi:hypothetical protein